MTRVVGCGMHRVPRRRPVSVIWTRLDAGALAAINDRKAGGDQAESESSTC